MPLHQRHQQPILHYLRLRALLQRWCYHIHVLAAYQLHYLLITLDIHGLEGTTAVQRDNE